MSDARARPSASLLEDALRAAGGVEVWRNAVEWSAALSTGGLAFRTRGQPALEGVRATVATTGQRVTLDPFPGPGSRGTWTAGTARLQARDGRVFEERRVSRWPRRWDALQMLAFVGLALWTYASLPFVLADDDVDVEAAGRRRLAVRFPDRIHTHCRRQLLTLDDAGLIRRHDYTALAFGRWARAAQHVSAHTGCGSIRVPLLRRVVPRLGRVALPGPTLVWIRLRDVSLR